MELVRALVLADDGLFARRDRLGLACVVARDHVPCSDLVEADRAGALVHETAAPDALAALHGPVPLAAALRVTLDPAPQDAAGPTFADVEIASAVARLTCVYDPDPRPAGEGVPVQAPPGLVLLATAGLGLAARRRRAGGPGARPGRGA